MNPIKTPSNSSSNISQINNNFVQIFCNSFGYIELLIHLILLPISFIFVFLIVRTSLLHWNLKFILLWQCFCNLIYGISRTIEVLNMLIYNVDFYNSQHKFIEMLGLGSMILGTFIGHVLILERILATVFVSKYENNKKPYFSIFCFIIVTSLSFQNAYQQTYGDCILDVTLGTFITFCGTLSLGLIEIALAENIRTSRQLKPTFVLHFVNILVSSGITFILNYLQVKVSIKDVQDRKFYKTRGQDYTQSPRPKNPNKILRSRLKTKSFGHL
uniref:Uncharacterized protein n=1 Tax=Meloidogyne enterolobii TaxID=390850 RepID=A0A6V7WVH1_MELEN|nr:unnamed protein product [Meloidogyne enterolobii]